MQGDVPRAEMWMGFTIRKARGKPKSRAKVGRNRTNSGMFARFPQEQREIFQNNLFFPLSIREDNEDLIDTASRNVVQAQ
ncbi:hypothetical protein AMTR_s00051p00088130 [Amborella trichopoda]|uniref:Uncharacterized protein n=1 Tax=Amborella trichopoda TaxID=13333 RepID=U5D2I7_AMBTC|nr:hypothetical protein AMTR_s00051p00088130 [Amborella trichopoda]